MSTRILRDKRARNRPPWLDSYGHVQRTKPHVCGRNCPHAARAGFSLQAAIDAMKDTQAKVREALAMMRRA